MSLTKLTLAQAKKKLENKEISATELTQSFIEEIEKNKHINAYITQTPERALADAKESDTRFLKGENRLLEGLPIGMKDLFCTQGIRTTAGSKILNNFIPPYESTVSQNLKDAGTVLLGKLNMDEFAMGSCNTNSAYGAVINPWKSSTTPNEDLVPGGSSGGSSAAVAANIAMAATGSDTGGSIRQPAAFTGLVGIKPTYGLCSRWGMIAFASSLDQAGPITKTIEDAALMLEAMAGHDEKDATSLNVDIPPYAKLLNMNLKGLRIGIPSECLEGFPLEMQQLVAQGQAWLKEAGAEIVDIHLPHTVSYALPAYYILAPAEASSNLARYDGVRYGLRAAGNTLDEMYSNTRHEYLGDEVKRRIIIGTYVLSSGCYNAYYGRALKIRKLIKEEFNQAFSEVDLMLTPTTPSTPFPLNKQDKDLTKVYANDIFTVMVNLAGLPGISVPAGLSQEENLPLGLQLIGPKLSEQRLLNAGLAIEKFAEFKRLFS